MTGTAAAQRRATRACGTGRATSFFAWMPIMCWRRTAWDYWPPLLEEPDARPRHSQHSAYFQVDGGGFRELEPWEISAPGNVCGLEHIMTTIKTPAASGNYLYTR